MRKCSVCQNNIEDLVNKCPHCEMERMMNIKMNTNNIYIANKVDQKNVGGKKIVVWIFALSIPIIMLLRFLKSLIHYFLTSRPVGWHDSISKTFVIDSR